MVQRHDVVVASEDGGVEVHRLKGWLRQHPHEIPPCFGLTSSTRINCEAACVAWDGPCRKLRPSSRLIKPGSETAPEILRRRQRSGYRRIRWAKAWHKAMTIFSNMAVLFRFLGSIGNL